MLWVPQKGIIRVQHNTGAVGAAQIGTAVTTGASSGTKGTPAELIASTSFDAYLLMVMASDYGNAATASQCMLDILIGAATEEVLIPNLLAGNAALVVGAGHFGKLWTFPLYIPAGSRLAAQAAGARVSTALRVAVYLCGGSGIPPFRVGSKVVSYPTAPSVPRGRAITPGASGAEGSWTEIVASTGEDHFALVPSFQCETDTTMSARNIAVDLGVGSATEEEVAQSYWFTTTSGETGFGPLPNMPAYVDVPSGSRLVVRASNSGTNDAAYGAMVHAVS